MSKEKILSLNGVPQTAIVIDSVHSRPSWSASKLRSSWPVAAETCAQPRERPQRFRLSMAQSDDPVASGFVASLARPGGNITGLSTLSPELSGKRLEILKEVVPKLSRVAVFGTSSS